MFERSLCTPYYDCLISPKNVLSGVPRMYRRKDGMGWDGPAIKCTYVCTYVEPDRGGGGMMEPPYEQGTTKEILSTE